MATWTSRANLGALNEPSLVTSSGTKIYWVDNAGDPDVWEYDPSGHVTTKIITYANITDISGIAGLCWFNGDLYVYVRYTSPTPVFDRTYRVEKWTGVVDGLTPVDTVMTHTNTGGLLTDARMYVASGVLVATFIAAATFVGPASTSRYSSNGSSWSTASFSTLPYRPTGSAVSPFPYASHHPTILHEFLCTSNVLGACTSSGIFKFTGSAWTLLPSTTRKYIQGIVDTVKYWTSNGSARWTTDFIAETVTTGPAVKTFQINMPWSPGVEAQASSTDLYQFDGNTTWVLFETIATFRYAGGNDTMVRLDNGDVFLMGFDNSSSVYRIIQRDEAIIDATAARLWIYKFDGAEWSSRGVAT